jgi:hypothetical protein
MKDTFSLASLGFKMTTKGDCNTPTGEKIGRLWLVFRLDGLDVRMARYMSDLTPTCESDPLRTIGADYVTYERPGEDVPAPSITRRRAAWRK